jgi:hypothetical protein
MDKSVLLRVVIMVATLLTGCARLPVQPLDPQVLPSPSNSWTLSLTQSGGFVGTHLEVEVSSDGHLKATDVRSGRVVTQDLSQDAINQLAQLYSSVSLTTPSAPHSGCADCYLYDLQARVDGHTFQIQADDTTLADTGASELIMALQRLRDDALRSQP